MVGLLWVGKGGGSQLFVSYKQRRAKQTHPFRHLSGGHGSIVLKETHSGNILAKVEKGPLETRQ